MPSQDRLEVIGPSGEVHFYPLDAARGITNIGRHPDNDVVIEAPNVAPFHAVIDHRHLPYEIVILSENQETRLRGEALSPNVARPFNKWDALEVDSHVIILVEGDGAVAVGVPRVIAVEPQEPAEPAPAKPTEEAEKLPAVPAQIARSQGRRPDQVDEHVIAELTEPQFVIDVDQTAMYELTVINGGPIVASFVVEVEGINPDWVNVIYPQNLDHINLNERGDRGKVLVEITPPRHPSSLAGPHYPTFVVTSPDYPGRSSVLGATLLINAYHEFSVSDLDRKEQALPWYKPQGRTAFRVNNRGNSTTAFRLEANDNEQACSFEFVLPGENSRQGTRRAPPIDVQLSAGHALNIPLLITPLSQPLVGLRKRVHPYTVTTTMLSEDQTPWPLQGRVKVRPVIGPFLLFLILISMAAILVAIFNPSIRSFQVDPTVIAAGDRVILQWEASPFANLRLSSEPSEDILPPIDDPVAQMTVEPPVDTTYYLESGNFLTRLPLLPRLFTLEQEVQVKVNPVLPAIRVFQADREQIVMGESVDLRWEAVNATDLTLSVNGNRESLLSSELETGMRTIYPLESVSNLALIATNRYGTVERSISVQAYPPTPTPLPQPHILSFDVNPKTIYAGQSVTVTWNVEGATGVEILGQLYLPQGQTVQALSEVGTVEYVLTGIYDDGTRQEKSVSPPITINVREQPTPTPEPVPPEIELFDFSYSGTFYRGESKTVELIWTVTGDTTNIELEGPTIGTVSQLAEDGTQSVVINDDTYFTLKVYYEEELKKSQMIQIAAEDPPPPPPPDPIIDYFELKPLSAGTFERQDMGDYVVYTVEAGISAEFSWSVRNVPVVALLEQELRPTPKGSMEVGSFDPTGTYPRILNTESRFTLEAVNEADPPVRVSQMIWVKLESVPEPPPPYDFEGLVPPTTPMTLTWRYDDSTRITGFVIYRFDPLDEVATEAEQIRVGKDQRMGDLFFWRDDAFPPSLCGIAYRIKALYYNEFGVETETEFATEKPTYSCSVTMFY